MTAPTWWPRFTAWLRTALDDFTAALAASVWFDHGLNHVVPDDPRMQHTEVLKLSVESARDRESNPLHDHLLRALVRSVAQATVEYVAEQDYDGPADLFAERKQLAEEVARFTMACAAEEDDVAVNQVRRAMRR